MFTPLVLAPMPLSVTELDGMFPLNPVPMPVDPTVPGKGGVPGAAVPPKPGVPMAPGAAPGAALIAPTPGDAGTPKFVTTPPAPAVIGPVPSPRPLAADAASIVQNTVSVKTQVITTI